MKTGRSKNAKSNVWPDASCTCSQCERVEALARSSIGFVVHGRSPPSTRRIGRASPKRSPIAATTGEKPQHHEHMGSAKYTRCGPACILESPSGDRNLAPPAVAQQKRHHNAEVEHVPGHAAGEGVAVAAG